MSDRVTAEEAEKLVAVRERWERSGYAPWKDAAFAVLSLAERLLTERDTLKREMESRELHHFESEVAMEGLAAILKEVRAAVERDRADAMSEMMQFTPVVAKASIRDILAKSPADALAAHDRDVAERCAQIVEKFFPDAHDEHEVCEDCLTVRSVAAAIRREYELNERGSENG